jgi:hypothetical protein
LTNAKDVSLEADGQPYVVTVIGNKTFRDTDSWNHTVYGTIGFAEFERIAASSKAAVRVGAIRFDLVAGHLQGMRDLIRALP